MRLNYTEDEDFAGQFALWQANCDRSLRGKAGQAALKRLESALLAMPEKRLIRGKLVDHSAQVCALGALAKAEGKLPEPEPITDDEWHDDIDDSAEFGETVLKFPRLVAWKVVEMNDIQIDDWHAVCEGPTESHSNYGRGSYDNRGVWTRFEYTPEERYEKMLAWVRENLEVEKGRR